MPKKTDMNKILVIGSGPITIGQAAEFDYAGTQACLTLKEEGYEVVLLNNNPATIMTDEHIAHKVYFEPLTIKSIVAIIEKEQPDAMLVSVSGQTGLNLAFSLYEQKIFEKYQIDVLGTPIEAIMEGEDREKFRSLMQEIDEPIPESVIVETLEDGLAFTNEVGYPIIVRPAYTLGGSGGGIATGENAFTTYMTRGLRASPIGQCLIEKSIAGWKEIEMEVVRDTNDHAVVVCHMENIDPVGVHTGDSIVVSPIQTLQQRDIDKLKAASLKIVRAIGIIGACNVQLAFDPLTKNYIVIEINPRVSRSSALASKATGYPIAKIATKLSIGYTLDEIFDAKRKVTLEKYEPKLDYTVVKFPSWPFEKFVTADRKLGTQMKATGEVMAIEKTIIASLHKAIRSLELKMDGLTLQSIQHYDTNQLKKLVHHTDDRRFFVLLELIRRGVSITAIHAATKIDEYFLKAMETLVVLEENVKASTIDMVEKEQLLAWKQAGFLDEQLATWWDVPIQAVANKRREFAITSVYDAVQAFSEQEDEEALYYYATWQADNIDEVKDEKEKVVIVGSGPIRIGQGVEFDYCSVQGVKALQMLGYETILINNNPSTVSTDYEFADKLYIEPLTAEDVFQVMQREGTNKVIVQFGGQTAINLVEGLEAYGVQILGSSMKTIDTLEDRDLFYQYVQQLNVPHIPGLIAKDETELYEKAAEIGYPVLVRPSYVIGGQGMATIENEKAMKKYVHYYLQAATSYPILIDAFYPGKEIEVDVVTDGENIFIPAIFEHIEKAGVHSGDSMAVTPPITLDETTKQLVVQYAEKIAQGIAFKGIFNIQFVLYDDVLYVLEVNPRASRTVPVISKVTGVNMIELATKLLLGASLQSLVGAEKILRENKFYTVKAPVFSSQKLPGVDPVLVPEMKSTGEIIAIGKTYGESLHKAFIWNEQLENTFQQTGKELYVASPTETIDMETLLQNVPITSVEFDEDVSFETVENWLKEKTSIVLFSNEENSVIRERAIEYNVLVLSSEATLEAFLQMENNCPDVWALQQEEGTNVKEVVLQ